MPTRSRSIECRRSGSSPVGPLPELLRRTSSPDCFAERGGAARGLLLQDDRIAGTQPGKNLGFGPVRDAHFDRNLAPTRLLAGIGDLHAGRTILVVDHRLLGNGQDML